MQIKRRVCQSGSRQGVKCELRRLAKAVLAIQINAVLTSGQRGEGRGYRGVLQSVYQYAWVCEKYYLWLFAVVLIIFPPPL